MLRISTHCAIDAGSLVAKKLKGLRVASCAFAPFALRGRRKWFRKLRGNENPKREGRTLKRRQENGETEARRPAGSCLVRRCAGTGGFCTAALKESTSRAVKCRRGGDIIIVVHDGRGWLDQPSDARGDVFGLAQHPESFSLGDALASCHVPGWCQRAATRHATDQMTSKSRYVSDRLVSRMAINTEPPAALPFAS